MGHLPDIQSTVAACAHRTWLVPIRITKGAGTAPASMMPHWGARNTKQAYRIHTNWRQALVSGRSLPLECVFALSPEVVHVGLEMQLEDVVLVNVLRL